MIRADLQPAFWHQKSILIGHSFGAYLLLHALAEMKFFVGRILLFLPVLGVGISKDGHFGSIPPRSKKLLKLAESGKFPAPRYLEIHTGAEDNGCDPRLAKRFAFLVENTNLQIVRGAGHQLGEKYLRNALGKFFMRNPIGRVFV